MIVDCNFVLIDGLFIIVDGGVELLNFGLIDSDILFELDINCG